MFQQFIDLAILDDLLWKVKALCSITDNLLFYVDGQSQQALLPPSVTLTELLGFKQSDNPAWNTGSRIAPFDTDVRDFPLIVLNETNIEINLCFILGNMIL